jgi:hypothetical protein
MGQSFVRVENWREASFKVHYAIFAQILDLFIRNPLQCLLRLHDRDGVLEALQIFGEATLIRAAMKPLRQCLRIVSRKVRISHSPCQINHGLRTQHTIQMLVQKNLRTALQCLFIRFH